MVKKPSTGSSRTRAEKPTLLCENQVQGEYSMDGVKNQVLTHLSLFSGIGGLALDAEEEIFEHGKNG